jgi:hypothetical protein
MFHRTWTGSLGACAAILLAVPATASALTATVNQRCYTNVPTKGSQPVVVNIAGGTPGATFQVSATIPHKGTGSDGFQDGTFDANGDGTATIDDVFPPSGTIDPTRGQTVLLSVEDFGAATPQDVPVGQFLVTTLAMNVSDKPVDPHARRVVTVSGTPFAGRRLWGFIVKPRSNHVLRRFSLGTGDVCGFTSAKAVVAPADFHLGTYRLYVNPGSRLDKSHAIDISFQIFRRFF